MYCLVPCLNIRLYFVISHMTNTQIDQNSLYAFEVFVVYHHQPYRLVSLSTIWLGGLIPYNALGRGTSFLIYMSRYSSICIVQRFKPIYNLTTCRVVV